MITKPERSRYLTSRFATIAAMNSPASLTRFRPSKRKRERERLGEIFGGCWREGVAVFGHFRKIAERQNKERTLARFLTNLRCGLVGSEPDINRVSQ